jgi:hypothetical protein
MKRVDCVLARERGCESIVRIDEGGVEIELIDLVKFRPEALGWHFRYSQGVYSLLLLPN